MIKKYDKAIATLFALLTVVFIIAFFTNDTFFQWAFARHHNIGSWYMRPLFIVPMVYFALRKSYAGVTLSIFCLFTSMFWFAVPEQTDPKVLSFLAYEMDYLKGTWNTKKILAKCTAFFLPVDSLCMAAKMALITLHRSVSSTFKTVMERGEQWRKWLVSCQTCTGRTGYLCPIYLANKKKKQKIRKKLVPTCL